MLNLPSKLTSKQSDDFIKLLNDILELNDSIIIGNERYNILIECEKALIPAKTNAETAIDANALAENEVFIAQLKAYLDLKNMDLINRDLLSKLNQPAETTYVPMTGEQLKANIQQWLDEGNYATVDKDQLQTLTERMLQLKSDIVALVTVFNSFSGLLKGNAGPLAIGSAIMKLMKDDTAKEKLLAVIPVIERYTETNG